MTQKPFVFTHKEDDSFRNNIKNDIEAALLNDSRYLLSYPVVYIHNWKPANNNSENKYDFYVGESNDVVERTGQHYSEASNQKNWQYHLLNDGTIPDIYVIGHKHFNKSLTLDIENRLMHYISSMPNVNDVHNGRGNPQTNYYPDDEFDAIFHSIWRMLRKLNKDVFVKESLIKDSAIFKASPLHKLTDEQLAAKNLIISKVIDAISNNKTGQLIFVHGGAGTGKTVLNSSTFYEILDNQELLGKKLNAVLMVNHDEQVEVYKEIAERLRLVDEYGEGIVCKPTSFINRVDPNDPVDVAFVDEAHLLLTQGKQSYTGKNQLEDIMARARVTVVMFDPYQVLTTEEYWEKETLDFFINTSISQDNYIVLKNQLRMTCSDDTKNWLEDILNYGAINPLGVDSKGYEVKVFDDPAKLQKEIVKKSKFEETKLSRIIASYDWDYSSLHAPANDPYWGVKIGSWFLPWNRELQKTLTKDEKKQNKHLAWAEQKQTINECGSTFTIQGFDLSYAGVIIGPSVKYENGKIVFHPECSANQKAIQNRTLEDGTKQKFGEELIRNELRVLLTRGVKGLYIYACDDALRAKLKEAVE